MIKNLNLASCDSDATSISVAQAKKTIIESVMPLQESQTIPLMESCGRITARNVICLHDVPNHTNSAMDGYAFNSADFPDRGKRKFAVIGTSLAGSQFKGPVGKEQCVRIMTGAVMPAGTDTVVIQERVERTGDSVCILSEENKGANVRYAGEDMQAGDVVVPAGTRIGASHLGLLASLGMPEVEVLRRPKIAYFSNGDELRPVGTPLEPGEVYDSNRYTLFAMLGSLDVERIDLGVIKDNRQAITKMVKEASTQADMVITTAGASVGEADYIKEVLTSLGKAHFWKVAVKPGRPLSFGRLGQTLFFGLPGNPVSVMVTFQIFVRPAIQRLAGEKDILPTVLKLRTTSDLRKRPGRMEFQRGLMFTNDAGETVVRSTGAQGSGILSSMSRANCFIILSDDSSGAGPGEWVDVQPFDKGI